MATQEPQLPAGDSILSAEAATPEARQGWVTRQLGDVYTYREALKQNPLKGTFLAIILFALGVAGNEVIDRLKAHFLPPDEFLAQMSENQKQQFEDLKKNLGDIQNSLSNEDRTAFRGVKDAVSAIEKSNSDLIQQLVLAKQENESLQKVSQQKTGISGGYDFILTPGAGVRLDAATVLGVEQISRDYGVTVNLTSRAEVKTINEALKSGQSIAYQNAKGQSCKVSVLSINSAGSGSASFVVGCS